MIYVKNKRLVLDTGNATVVTKLFIHNTGQQFCYMRGWC